MSSEFNDVIDLTDSFTLIDHCELADVVIELDDSIYCFPPDSSVPGLGNNCNYGRTNEVKNKKKSSTSKKCRENTPVPLAASQSDRSKPSKGIGDCPVCWDELGKNPIASTKCGHVFCMHCIEKVVKQSKTCPTCRSILKGASAYHPIYLSLQ